MLVSIHTPEDLGDAADLMAFVARGRVLAVGPPGDILRSGREPGDRPLSRPLTIAMRRAVVRPHMRSR